MGGSYDAANGRFSPFKFKPGKPPQGPREVAVDVGTAKDEHYAIGDSVVVSTLGKKHTYKLSGTVSFGSVDSLGFASIAAWDVETAQSLFNREGRFDSISVAAKDGTTPAQLVKAIDPLIPATLQVKDAQAQAASDADELNDSLSIIRNVLLGFGAIALLVGAFVIFNTISITVAQRTREFATLRTLGASRKQVKREVRIEGVVIGLVASLVGLVLGIGLAKGLVALFTVLGFELPDASTVIKARTVWVSILLGTGITLLASILPARRATRIPPIAAVREGAVLPAPGSRPTRPRPGWECSSAPCWRSPWPSSAAWPGFSRRCWWPAGCSRSSWPSPCFCPGWWSRWPEWWAGPRAAGEESRASWPRRTRFATRAARRPPPPRS